MLQMLGVFAEFEHATIVDRVTAGLERRVRAGLVRCHQCGRAYVGTSAHGRSSRYTYYACSTRYKYGPGKCAASGFRRTDSKQPCSPNSPTCTATAA
jgi:hypothetical protein